MSYYIGIKCSNYLMNLCSVELIRKYLEKMIVFFGQDVATFLIYRFLKTYLPKSDVPQPGGSDS